MVDPAELDRALACARLAAADIARARHRAVADPDGAAYCVAAARLLLAAAIDALDSDSSERATLRGD